MGPGFENVHRFIDQAFAEPDRQSDDFRATVMAAASCDSNPVFAALRESSRGHGQGAKG